MSQFLAWCHMGGYSFYVWSSYGLGVLVFAWNGLGMWLHRVRIRKQLKQWFKRQ